MWNIGWGLTNICNLNCDFCYSQAIRKLTNEITDINILKKFIDSNFHLVRSVNFGTGENTLCSIWIEIVRYIYEKFPTIIQGLTTNGYLSVLCSINPIAERIVADCLEEIDVSLDFGKKEKHINFRSHSHVYDWAIKTLELCQRLKKRTSIVFMGTNETLAVDNIKVLFNIAKEYDAIIRLNLYRPKYGQNNKTKKYIPDFENVRNALEYINNNYKILSLSDPLFSSIYTSGEKHQNDPSGVSSVRILPDGSITPSTYLITDEFRKLNIKTERVFDKLNKDDFKNLIKRIIPKECAGCQYEYICRGGAFDRRYLWYGDFNKKDPYCPFDKNKNININKLKIATDTNFKSIHDGYLPTLFFSN